LGNRTHNFFPDSVTATASSGCTVSQWQVKYDLLLESESEASHHLVVAQELAADTEVTSADLAQSFTDSGLTMEAAGFAIASPDDVQVYQSCYSTDVGLKDPFDDGCDTYQRNPNFCGLYDDVDFRSDDFCCTCGGGNDREPDWAPATEEPILPPEPGCVDTDLAHKDFTGDGCSVYVMDLVHFCGEFDDDDFSSMVMCCACHPCACHPYAPPPLMPTPAPGDGVLDGATPLWCVMPPWSSASSARPSQSSSRRFESPSAFRPEIFAKLQPNLSRALCGGKFDPLGVAAFGLFVPSPSRGPARGGVF